MTQEMVRAVFPSVGHAGSRIQRLLSVVLFLVVEGLRYNNWVLTWPDVPAVPESLDLQTLDHGGVSPPIFAGCAPSSLTHVSMEHPDYAAIPAHQV